MSVEENSSLSNWNLNKKEEVIAKCITARLPSPNAPLLLFSVNKKVTLRSRQETCPQNETS